jgi:hypothetical protein
MGALARPVTPDKVISFTIALTRGVWCSALLADYSRDPLTKVTRRDRSVTNDQLDDLRIECLHRRVSGGELPSLSQLPVQRWINASLPSRLEADAHPTPL